jgi:hypothetical protein
MIQIKQNKPRGDSGGLVIPFDALLQVRLSVLAENWPGVPASEISRLATASSTRPSTAEEITAGIRPDI